MIGTAVAIALFGPSGPVQARELEEVVVTGIRGSLRESLETKREANAVVEALSAEDLGEFPNTNIAEAMTRFPASPSIAASARASASASTAPIPAST